MPGFDAIEPLARMLAAPIAPAPCFYWHTKLQALNGGFGKLTDEERAFVGVGAQDTPVSSDGWQSPLASLIDQLGADVSPAEVAWLERLAGMDAPNQERLEFLGG